MSGSPLTAPGLALAAMRPVRRAPVRWFAGVQDLSLDIVAGVVCAAAFAVAATGATLPPSFWVLLPLATWVVYSADHLLDARRAGAGSQQSRHRFFHRRFRGLAGLTLLLLPAGALAGLALLPPALRVPAFLIGLAAAAHLALAQLRGRWVVKEFSAAAIYVGAIWFGPILLAPRLDPATLALVGLHLIAALANLIAYALFEERSDALDGHASIVRSWGRPRALGLLAALTVVGLVAVGLVGLSGTPLPPVAMPVLLILIATPGVMVCFSDAFAAHQAYRIVGDLSFLLLALPFLLSRG